LPDSVTIKQLLEAGAHFGHQTSRWHPRMKSYIFTKRNGIHILDLEQTTSMLDKACEFVRQVVAEGGNILFVGTKKQAQETVKEEAERCDMYYVNQRWIGGTLTNFATIQARIDHLVRLEDQQTRGEFNRLPKKEALKLTKEISRLNQQMGGFKVMTSLPNALFIVDPTKERIALAEAKRVGIPVVAIADTNCNPDDIDYPIPSNDDAIKAIKLVCSKIAEAVIEAKSSGMVSPTEEGAEVGMEELETTEVVEATEPIIPAAEAIESVEATEPIIPAAEATEVVEATEPIIPAAEATESVEATEPIIPAADDEQSKEAD
jgi:small subunit ribosomal protein S2